MSPKSSFSLFLASGCYIGFIPGAPGTYASVATTAVLYAISRTHAHAPEIYVSVFCLITAAGVLASTEAARSRGLKDPSFVVIDEVSGQLAAFLVVPLELRNLVLGT